MVTTENIEQQESDNAILLSIDKLPEWSFFWCWLFPVIAMVFFLKSFVAWFFPFTGDEAYLALRGKKAAWGYYDHPPVLGWILYLVQYISKSSMAMRLVPIIFTTLVLGSGFNYQEYRKQYLRTIARRYYQIPDWLPGSQSFFHEKYDLEIRYD